MARNFDGSTQLDLTAADAAVMHVVEPYAIGLWVKNSSNPGSFLYALSKVLTPDDHSSYAFSTDSGGNLRFIQGHSTNAGGFVTSPTIASANIWDGAWHHVMGSADGSRVKIYLDGGEVGSPGTVQVGGTAYATGAAAGLFVGSFDGPRNSLYFKGGIAEVAIFDAIPSAGELLALAKGYTPLAVMPANVVMYWPLLGRFDPETDPAGGVDLTNHGTIRADNSPRIIGPAGKQVVAPKAGTPPVVTAPGIWGISR
jgi:hypothetical protein